MNLGEQYKKAWFDYKDNIDRDTLPSLLDDKFEWRSLTKAFNDKTIESKDDTLETLKGVDTTTSPEVHYSSDEMLQNISGEKLNPSYYSRHLKERFLK